MAAGTVKEMELKGSNVLKYKLADGTDLVVRSSGTEPKVKVYILAQGAARQSATRRWPSTPPGRRP